ncbi:MAG: PEP-utilizing enzyme [Candidatus Woesearchaeota archaeon]
MQKKIQINQISKAERLIKLKKIVKVPFFQVIKKNEKIPKLDKAKLYMVRSSSYSEDQENISNAGLSKTIGPIKSSQVKNAVSKILEKDTNCKIIVQEYVKGINGVAFCFSENYIFIEYSAIFEGVTSGKIIPFTKIITSKNKKINHKKFRKLVQELRRIYNLFGSCDVEFIDIKEPKFVQVRPITKKFKIDKELKILEILQDLGRNWIEDDFCKVLPERKQYSNLLIRYYINELIKFHKKFSKRNIKLSDRCFLETQKQYFIDQEVIKQTKLTLTSIVRIAIYWNKNKNNIINNLPRNISDSIFNSIILSTIQQLLNNKEIINIREKYRVHIEKLLKNTKENNTKNKKEYIYTIKTKKKLNPILKLDTNKKIWITNPFQQEKGITIVKNMPDGPYQIINSSKDVIKENHVIVCPQLYPSIGKNIKKLKGIICEGGSNMSHVSILARENKIPLIIQKNNARKRFK